MSDSETKERISQLEALVQGQANQIEGLKQAVNILIGMVTSELDPDEPDNDFGPQGPSPPTGFNN